MKTELTKMQIELQDAIDFLTQNFRNIFRKDGFPGLIHPLQVTQKLNQWGITFEKFPRTWKKSLYHDIPEDCKLRESQDSLKLIREKDGDEVADEVGMLTLRPKRDDESSKDYQLYKQSVLATYIDKPIDVLLIKVADRLRNVTDFLESDHKYAVKYFHYADSLFAAVKNRRQEIVDRFGEKVWNNVFTEVLQFETLIVKIELGVPLRRTLGWE